MMIGESHLHYNTLTRNNRSSWIGVADDPSATIITSDICPTPPIEFKTNSTGLSYHMRPSPLSVTDDVLLTALCRYMESNEPVEELEETGIPIDGAYASTDEFRMYEFKVRPCTRAKAHDWTECPFAHPGEKARRRDPLRYSYSGTACTDFRKGSCRRGDTCEFAHGVFECWLHPTRYRTQACKDGQGCTRRVCFFAHAPDQLRVVSGQPSPRSVGSGPDPYEDVEASPPLTPVARGYGSGTVNELVASLRNLQLNKVKSMPSGSGWGGHIGSPRFGSVGGSVVRSGFYSLPTTPTRPVGAGYFDTEEEPVMERVESGRELRARMFEKLSKENPLTLPDTVESGGSGLDVGWVTDLVK